MKQFKDRVAVVTGAASDIGRGLAGRFAEEGMNVVLADIEAGALAETAGVLRQGATTPNRPDAWVSLAASLAHGTGAKSGGPGSAEGQSPADRAAVAVR